MTRLRNELAEWGRGVSVPGGVKAGAGDSPVHLNRGPGRWPVSLSPPTRTARPPLTTRCCLKGIVNLDGFFAGGHGRMCPVRARGLPVSSGRSGSPLEVSQGRLVARGRRLRLWEGTRDGRLTED